MEGFFLKLVDMSVTASWLVLAVIALRFVFQIAPKSLRVCMWGLVALRLVCPFSLESSLSMVPDTQFTPQTVVTAQAPADHAQTPAANPTPVNHTSAKPSAGSPAAPAVIQAPSAPVEETDPVSAATVAGWIWLIGVLCIVIYTAASYLHIYGKTREGMPLKGNVWICDRIDTPFILGILNPRIFLPSTMDQEDLRYVIAHERAHLKRHDHWWKHIGFALLAVHWFNPVIWVAYILLCRDIELACDERVIREMGKKAKKPYSNALINCSASRRTLAACPLAFGEVGVKGRIKTVLNYRKPAFWFVIVAVVACIIVAVCFMTDPPADDAQTTDPTETSEVTEPSDETVNIIGAPDEDEVIAAAQRFLDLHGAEQGNNLAALEILGLGSEPADYSAVPSVTINSNTFYQSDIRYDDLRNGLLTYMSERLFERRYAIVYAGLDASLYHIQGAGGSGCSWYITDAELESEANGVYTYTMTGTYYENEYTALETIRFDIVEQNGIYVVDDYEILSEDQIITEDTLGEKDVLFVTEAIDNGNGTFTLKGVIFDHDEDYYNPDVQITDRWELTDRWCTITLRGDIPCEMEYSEADTVEEVFADYGPATPTDTTNPYFENCFNFVFEGSRVVGVVNIVTGL